MLRTVFYLILSIVFFGCKNNQASASHSIPETNNIQSVMDSAFFKAYGDQWTLEISEQAITFRSELEGIASFSAPTTEPIRVMDANIKTYRSHPEAGEIEVTIAQEHCMDSTMDYSVSLKLKRSTEDRFMTVEGCGEYIMDYRLHDIWVLKTLGGEQVSATEFREELPQIEIDSHNKRMTGFGGCNRIMGAIFTEQNLIRFTRIGRTKMLCAPPNREDEFIKALESTTTFEIINNQLILSNPDRETLTLQKID